MTVSLLKRVQPNELQTSKISRIDPTVMVEAQRMLDHVRTQGEKAVLELAIKFGDVREGGQVVYTKADLAAARDSLDVASRQVLERVAHRIREFAASQRASVHDLKHPVPGGYAGHSWIPVTSAGCYAPGGRFPLPSSVLMTAVTARVAGVSNVWVASPRPTVATLAAACIAGADGLLAVGGVQAIGAFAYGLMGVPQSELIVGPGNRWVTAAKFIVSESVGIDMLAGPSELLVIADDSADPVYIAADLIAQAEHDADAVPMLVTTSEQIADAVNRELGNQLETLVTAPVARQALNNGWVCVVGSIQECIAIADVRAAEHLQVMTRDAAAVAGRVTHAGAVFVGSASGEVFGDYGFGPNHVLPTAGGARYKAGLSVLTFLRCRTWLEVENLPAAKEAVADAVALARLEGLEGHARAAEVRGLRG